MSTSGNNRPNQSDRKKLIRDLAHISKILEERVSSLEGQLEECQQIVTVLKRKLRREDANATE